MRISVTLPIYVFSNDLINLTKDCLLSLDGQYDEMIIVDNNSPLLGEEWQKKATIYIRNKGNLGFGAAANQGFKLATGDYICLVTNDTRLQKGNLKDLCEIADQGYAFPRIIGKESPEWDGAFFMFSRKVMEKNGIYDERFFPGYFEDSDLFYRATLKKLKLTRVDSVEVIHHQSRTSKPMGVRQTAYDACRDKFKEKWGFDFIEKYWLK